MDKRELPIAVFDSGVGGISVLKELIRLMPGENFLYFGDSANAPYGVRPTEQVRQLTLQAAKMLVSREIKALVLACNTATAAAVNLLREAYPELIVIGIEPALKLAADLYPKGHIGVMATQVTLREEKFAQQLERFPDASVSLIPAPGLVELIESGADTQKQKNLLTPLLQPYTGQLDALVLGCTHYPFAQKAIESILGPTVKLLHGGEGTARQTRRRLEAENLLFAGSGSVVIENSSKDPGRIQLCKRLLEEEYV